MINLSKKILVQIDTFPNTRDKIELTKLSVNSLKNLGYPILLTSHMDIPKELFDNVDYHYSDGNNILLPPSGDVNFFEYYGESFKMVYRLEDIDPHAPAVIKGWFNGIEFAIKKGYEWILKLEYDFIPSHEGLSKLTDEINKSLDKNGFILKASNNYVSQRCFFGKSEFLFDKVYKTIVDWKDYYYWSDKLCVPKEIRRMAPIFTYYSIEKYLENFSILSYSEDETFGIKLPKELKFNFPGFIRPLISNYGNFFICSYGMGWPTTEYYLKDSNGNILHSGNINLSTGVWSFFGLEIYKNETYYLSSDIETLVFNYDDVVNKKFGEIIFN